MPYVMALEGEGAGWNSVLSSLTAEISVSSIVGVLAAVATAVVGIVFLYWAVRKASKALMAAFRNGKLKVG